MKAYYSLELPKQKIIMRRCIFTLILILQLIDIFSIRSVENKTTQLLLCKVFFKYSIFREEKLYFRNRTTFNALF